MTLLDHNDHENIFEDPPIFKTDDVLPPDLIRRVKHKNKSCGNCHWFFKWKNDRDGGGLCESKDARTKPDWGKKCLSWRGIKYKRKNS